MKEGLKIGILGMGYVGLPLAIEFGKKTTTIGFDINKKRIANLSKGNDETSELTKKEIFSSKNLTFSHDLKSLHECNFFIITVPTPIHKNNKPDLSLLKNASKMVGGLLKKKDFVVFESTVYPGATEEICIPILEKFSSLKFNHDFFVGYSPERINPGDKKRTISNIKKVVSGSNKYATNYINNVYSKIITAGTHIAKNIKVAEAAKVIENTQRDLNIALVNELSILFEKLGIETEEVLKTAETKWNFHSFRPGLVGGHCIGVDPYYLTYKAKEVGYKPNIILAGRSINNSMPNFVVKTLLKKLKEKKINPRGSKAIILGLTFKENCSDLRNSKVIDLYKLLQQKGISPKVYDPWVDENNYLKQNNIDLLKNLNGKFDILILAVSHKDFFEISIEKFKKLLKKRSVVYDLKNVIDSSLVDIKL